MKNFKNSKYYRSKLIKHGVKKSAWSPTKNYSELINQLNEEGFNCLIDFNELHKAILTLRK